MFIAIAVGLISLLIFLLEYKQVKKINSKKDTIALVGGFFLSLTCAISMSLDFPLPSVNVLIDQLLQPITKPIANMLQSFQPK